MTPPTVADGPQSAPSTASSGTSTFPTATIQASSANAVNFFNTLLAPPFTRSVEKRIHALDSLGTCLCQCGGQGFGKQT